MLKFNETPEQEVLLNRLISEGCKVLEVCNYYDSDCGVSVTRTQFEARDGWIVWRGGERGVDDGVVVTVITRDGDKELGNSELFDWEVDGSSCDIVAYKAIRIKPQGHPHAELMAQYAEDAKTSAEPWLMWEAKGNRGKWNCGLTNHPIWSVNLLYRRKPKTKLIHGVEVPDISFAPKDGEGYYIPDVRLERMYSPNHCCDGCKFTSRLAGYGMCYPKTEEGKQAAILHAKAMLGTKP